MQLNLEIDKAAVPYTDYSTTLLALRNFPHFPILLEIFP